MPAELIAATYPTDPNSVSPGIVGFLVTFGVGIATVLLILNMVSRLRRLRYTPDPADQDADQPTTRDAGQPAVAGGQPAEATGRASVAERSGNGKAAQGPAGDA